MMSDMIYDIRTTESAQKTLTKLTGIPISTWKYYFILNHKYSCPGDLVADVINSHGDIPSNYKDFVFVYFHVTTSANECLSFRKHGILDLKQSYWCPESELRSFLEKHNVYIDLDERMLKYRKQRFDITYGDCPERCTEAYYRWNIGRKFYYDYTTCGFLSIEEKSAYGGKVHHRPEILMDIDNLLGLDLSEEWMNTHDSYEVLASISGKNIVYDGYDDESDLDKVLSYLIKAYHTAFSEPSEQILLIKNNVLIPPLDILEISPLKYWKND